MIAGIPKVTAFTINKVAALAGRLAWRPRLSKPAMLMLFYGGMESMFGSLCFGSSLRLSDEQRSIVDVMIEIGTMGSL